jgi:hypothetical protein
VWLRVLLRMGVGGWVLFCEGRRACAVFVGVGRRACAVVFVGVVVGRVRWDSVQGMSVKRHGEVAREGIDGCPSCIGCKRSGVTVSFTSSKGCV